MSKLVQAVRPVKTEETASHRQNNSVKEVGTPSVRSNLCTPLIVVSTCAYTDRPCIYVNSETLEIGLPINKTRIDLYVFNLVCMRDRQTDRQTETDGRTDGQTERQTDRKKEKY